MIQIIVKLLMKLLPLKTFPSWISSQHLLLLPAFLEPILYLQISNYQRPCRLIQCIQTATRPHQTSTACHLNMYKKYIRVWSKCIDQLCNGGGGGGGLLLTLDKKWGIFKYHPLMDFLKTIFEHVLFYIWIMPLHN